jgi:hypothetical protein
MKEHEELWEKLKEGGLWAYYLKRGKPFKEKRQRGIMKAEDEKLSVNFPLAQNNFV